MSEKIIFLDIDGVLINIESLRAGNTAHPTCVDHLNRIISETQADIVISSSWRKTGLERIAATLAEWGVIGRVKDITPDLSRNEKQVWIGARRGDEIEMWLRQNSGVVSFVILDDEADMGNLMHRLVRCDYMFGLTRQKADQAINILKEETMASTGHYVLKCPVCGRPAIGRIRVLGELNCGYHFWKYSLGRVEVLPPIIGGEDERRPHP